jgi:hypothetical protein
MQAAEAENKRTSLPLAIRSDALWEDVYTDYCNLATKEEHDRGEKC